MYIKIIVYPDSKKEGIEEKRSTGGVTLHVKVKVPAEQNLANKRMLELVSEHTGIPIAKLRIISGHHSPRKMLSVRD